MNKSELTEAYLGVLLGTACGDALGLAWEGMREGAVRYGSVRKIVPPYFLISDDTEQTVFVAEALCRYPTNIRNQAACFRRAMRGWFVRLPYGIGWGTLKACLRMLIGRKVTGVWSAGNGSAMRAALFGVRFRNDQNLLRSSVHGNSEVTHLDPRAREGALFVAQVVRLCLQSRPPRECVAAALERIDDDEVKHSVLVGLSCADAGNSSPLLRSGFILHSVAVISYVFARYGEDPRRAMFEAIALGGDTDTHAAILGAWLGAMHGSQWCLEWSSEILPGLGDEAHLRALAAVLSASEDQAQPVPKWSPIWAMLRNLFLFPVIFIYAVLRVPAGWVQALLSGAQQ